MPTVLRQGGFAVMIFSDDHTPAHVHVFKGEGLIVINLGSEQARPSARYSRRMKLPDRRAALRLVFQHQDELLARWREIHG